MIKNYQLLNELLPIMEEFESVSSKKGSKISADNFFNWYYNNTRLIDEKQNPTLYGDINAQITQLLALMNKYLKFYLKKGFEHTLLSGPDDFGFLATIFLDGEMRKNELIDKNTMEFSSGMEVIKRLEKQGLLESVIDSDDKRAKIVKLTEKGKEQMIDILPIMAKIGKITTAELDENEKEMLLALLFRLNNFHNPIFHNAKKDSVEEILENYLRES